MEIEDYNEYYIQNSNHYLIPKDVFMELFNEMINWKEEYRELEDKYKELDKMCELYSKSLYNAELNQYKNNWNKLKEWASNFYNSDNELRIYGQTDYEKQLIRIYKDLSYQRKRDTLIHELTHAFHDVYLASQHIKDKFVEEDVCCFMASYSEDILKIVNEYFKGVDNK